MYKSEIKKLILRGCAVAALLTSSACGQSSYDFPIIQLTLQPPVREYSLEELTESSAASYNDNRYGLISPATLEAWAGNWLSARPAGITGRLIVLQVHTGGAPGQFIRSDGANTFTYRVNASEFHGPRTNGVIETAEQTLAGAQADALLARYQIDIEKDLVVFAMDAPSAANLAGTLRAWFTFRYWGADARSLAVLNGSVSADIAPGSLVSAGSIQSTGSARSFRVLRRDHTVLYAHLSQARAAATGGTVEGRALRLLDVRPASAFAGAAASSVSGRTNCPNFAANGQRCFTAVEGRIRSAVSFPISAFTDGGFRFLSRGTIVTALSGAGITAGNQLLVYGASGSEASVAGFLFTAVLGIPAKTYEASWAEWGSLAGLAGFAGSSLPSDAPWRTDLNSVTEPGPIVYNVAGDVGAFTLDFFQSYRSSTDLRLVQDREYLRSGSTLAPGGSTRPGNPCGG